MTRPRWPNRPSGPHRAPRAELVQLPGGHYAPFLDAHEQAVAAEVSFLRRHLLGQPVPVTAEPTT